MWGIKLNPKKKKFMSTRWAKNEKELLIRLWEQGETFEEISDAINELNRCRAKIGCFDMIPHRTARSVAFKCRDLGLISDVRLKGWETDRNMLRKKDRARHWYQVKKEVFERDGNHCVVCRVTDSLEIAHIIPFEESRQNLVLETVTLCKNHHGHFDKGCPKCVEKVDSEMCKKDPEYSNKYVIQRYDCGHIRIRRTSISS